MGLQVGTAQAVPGRKSTGTFEWMPLVTGQRDDLPVVIACGKSDGPVLWLTATVHGNELAGFHAIHRVLNSEPLKSLRGTIVAIPIVNPSGFRQRRRITDFDSRDPNRLFPSRHFHRNCRPADEPSELPDDRPTALDMASERLLDAIGGSADALLDLHCAFENSVPFIFRDRVIYRDESDFAGRQALDERLSGLARALHIPVLNELPAHRYLEKNLHKSLSGAVLNEAGIPALTVELGPKEVYLPGMVDVGVKGIRNALAWLGMIDGNATPIPEIPSPPGNQPLRQAELPRAATTGILRYLAQPGEWIPRGTPFAEVLSVYGEVLETIALEDDCWVAGHFSGCTVHARDPIALVGLADPFPTLAQYPHWRRQSKR